MLYQPHELQACEVYRTNQNYPGKFVKHEMQWCTKLHLQYTIRVKAREPITCLIFLCWIRYGDVRNKTKREEVDCSLFASSRNEDKAGKKKLAMTNFSWKLVIPESHCNTLIGGVKKGIMSIFVISIDVYLKIAVRQLLISQVGCCLKMHQLIHVAHFGRHLPSCDIGL